MFLFLGCTASRAVELETALQLNVLDPPQRVTAGQRVEVRYSLRNNTTESLKLCSAGGVSMVLRSESRAKWPVILHGLTTDTECSGPISLGPGEERVFVESGGVSRDWPSGEAEIVGLITLWCARGQRCVEATLEQPVRVTVVSRAGV